MNVGYVGLGAMGGQLARRLLASHTLHVLDLSAAALAELEKLGARPAASGAELARRCDVVVLCLPRSSDVRQAIFGPGGLAEGLTAGKLVVDQTSGVPRETREMAERLAAREVAMVDAPIAGGTIAAGEGKAVFMLSGPDAACERALPVLRSMTPNVYRCGARVGDGQAMKIVNNTINADCRLGTLEVVAMGKKLGLSLAAMTDVLNKGSAYNRITQTVLPALIGEGQMATRFWLALMLKDVDQGVSLGMEGGVPMPLAGITRGLLQIGVNTLGPKATLDDVPGLVESMAGTKLAEPRQARPAGGGGDGTARARDLKTGFVGLGAMGGALATRLLASRKVQVHDARPESVRALVERGATAAQDLPSLARTSDVIGICLPTSAVVREVVLGKGGLAEGLSPGKIVIDHTSGDPIQTRAIAAELEKLGVALVDAPIASGPAVVAAGTVGIMCGGPPAAYAAVRPLLEALSPNLTYCGQTGNGHLAKIVHNAVAAINRLATYETVAMGFKFGLTVEDMATVLNAGSARCGATEKILPRLGAGGRTAEFKLELMVKDLRLAAQMGQSAGAPMLLANVARALFEAAANELGGTANLDEMVRVTEKASGLTFTRR